MMKHIRVQLAFRKESRRVASKDARSLQMPGGDFRVLGIQRLTGTGDGRGRRRGVRESKHECNALAFKLRLALAAI
jgi:hypothetical protein